MEKWPILLNQSYGAFQYSQKAIDEFNVRNKMINNNSKRKIKLEEEEDTRKEQIGGHKESNNCHIREEPYGCPAYRIEGGARKYQG